jgi:hypothetical protein
LKPCFVLLTAIVQSWTRALLCITASKWAKLSCSTCMSQQTRGVRQPYHAYASTKEVGGCRCTLDRNEAVLITEAGTSLAVELHAADIIRLVVAA